MSGKLKKTLFIYNHCKGAMLWGWGIDFRDSLEPALHTSLYLLAHASTLRKVWCYSALAEYRGYKGS